VACSWGVAEPEVLEGKECYRVAKLEEKCAGFSRGLGGREERECFFEGSGLELEEDYGGDEGS